MVQKNYVARFLLKYKLFCEPNRNSTTCWVNFQVVSYKKIILLHLLNSDAIFFLVIYEFHVSLVSRRCIQDTPTRTLSRLAIPILVNQQTPNA